MGLLVTCLYYTQHTHIIGRYMILSLPLSQYIECFVGGGTQRIWWSLCQEESSTENKGGRWK